MVAQIVASDDKGVLFDNSDGLKEKNGTTELRNNFGLKKGSLGY